MAGTDDLISFDVIESQKENIQSLPGGRSAKKLAQLYSPPAGSGGHGTPLPPQLTPTADPNDTRTLHETIRADFEAELAGINESDDPLDVYDRYVRWTMEAYPSMQATPQSQLHVLLERATRTFVGAAQYRNDPRFLRLWLHYIHFFSDAPREAYVYLARHNIGENLALFYEEYAGWLESAGRWAQADEVLRLGLDRAARPEARLLRKYAEFEQRRAAHAPESLDEDADRPASPALPTVRPALAAKVDPFASAVAAVAERDPQQAQRMQQQHAQQAQKQQAARSSKPKMAIFSDAAATEAPAMASAGSTSKGWQSIGSLAERKKENVRAAKPWAGEKLSAGGKKSTTKMAVFRDASLAKSHITIHPSQYQVTVNPQSGKKERIFVDLRTLYPTPDEPGTELSFEEVLADSYGLVDDDPWVEPPDPFVSPSPAVDLLADAVSTKLVVHRDTAVMLDENGAPMKSQDRETRPRKKKTEVNETQIIKTKLESPSGRKMKKKRGSISEPTMTMHTRAATDDIYEIFNQPLRPAVGIDDDAHETSDDDYESEDEYESGAESMGTTREAGEEAEAEAEEPEEVEEAEEVEETEEADVIEVGEVENEVLDARSEWSDAADRTRVSVNEDDDADEALSPLSVHGLSRQFGGSETPSLPPSPTPESPPRTRTVFIPIPPEDYVAPTRPYRDPAEVANNRLPFMTPITERTESSVAFDSEDSQRAMMAKTPSKMYSTGAPFPIDEDDEEEYEDEQAGSSIGVTSEAMSSPLIDVIDDDDLPQPPPAKLPQPLFKRPAPSTASTAAAVPPKGPLIKDKQCNPMEQSIRTDILAQMHPPLSAYSGFFDHQDEKCEKGSEIRRYAKAVGKSGSDRSSGTGLPVVIEFPDCPSQYTVRRELGAGAFAPVFLVENMHPEEEGEDGNDSDGPVAVPQMGRGAFAITHNRRQTLEALKMETPPTAWEFHMMRLAHARLGPQHRATASLAPGLECHLYRDETFLFLPYYPHGTLLDVVNLFRADASGVMDEMLAMFFAIELFRTVEALHSHGLIHGDLKADNCLLRLDISSATSSTSLSSKWTPEGAGGWAARGLTLIDFGRGVDMRAFVPDVQFLADWKTTAQDCAEMREGRPWTWQIDYHGLAGTLHCLLFGKYMETVRCDREQGLGGLGGTARRYRIRETLKRYWQTDIWGDAFDLLLNPAGHVAEEEGRRLPALRTMRHVRERMEAWLTSSCERGVGLKGLMVKVEGWARGRK